MLTSAISKAIWTIGLWSAPSPAQDLYECHRCHEKVATLNQKGMPTSMVSCRQCNCCSFIMANGMSVSGRVAVIEARRRYMSQGE